MTIPQPNDVAVNGNAVTPAALWQDIVSAFRYAVKIPGMVALFGIAMLINFVIAPSSSLIPLLVTQHFKGGVWHLGWIDSASGIGVVAGGLILTAWGGFRRKMVTTLSGVIGIGAGVLLLGISPSNMFTLAIAGAFLFGFMLPITNGPIMAFLQFRVDPGMQGRVITLLESFATAMMPVSLAMAGPISDRFGIQTWFVFGGAACILIALASFLIPSLYQMEDQPVNSEGESALPAVGASMPLPPD
jgi:DHA3 family macrolide efflux protein-like MFS transporter